MLSITHSGKARINVIVCRANMKDGSGSVWLMNLKTVNLRPTEIADTNVTVALMWYIVTGSNVRGERGVKTVLFVSDYH